ncbi:MAG: ExeM/NucH family extracellular endonuclease, partial [Chloroflexi bacterium]
ILAQADQTNGAGWFNGDDAVVLRRGSTVLDVIGQVGVDPGSEWGTGLQSTADNTLRRKAGTSAGDVNGADAFDPSAQWDGFATDTFDGLGFHAAISDLFFSEYIEGSSNNKALEIFNGTDTAVDLVASGYNVQMFFNGSVSAGLTINLVGTIAPNDVFVLAQSSANAAILAQADQTNGAGWFNGNDAVVLRKGAQIIDVIGQIGFNPGTEWGTGLVSTADNTLRRKLSVTKGDANGTDVFDPSIEWEGFAIDTFDGLGAHGGGDIAPSVTTTVPAAGATGVGVGSNITVTFSEPVNVSPNWYGIACASGPRTATVSGGPSTFTLDPSADFASGESCSVTIVAANVTDQDTQDPPDAMAANFTWSFATAQSFSCTDPKTPINPGDLVRVTGKVTEFSNLTEITSVTQAAICSTGNALAPATVTLPVGSYTDFERYEGMFVRFDQTLTATETFTLARFGEVRLAADGRLYTPTAVTTPGAAAIALEDENQRRSFVLDDGNNQQNIDPTLYPTGGLSAPNTLRSGYTTTGVTGVFDYRFNTYRLQPVGPVSFTAANPRTTAPDPVGGNTRVASFNVLNYFNGDGLGGGFPTSRGATTRTEFDRQTAKEVSALIALAPDIAGLMEIENDAGPNSALAQLVAFLNNSAGPGTYAYVDTGVIGTDEIKVALIYKPAAVTPVGAWQIMTSGTDPRFIDTRNRPSLAQTFLRNGTAEKVTVVVNHLKSKGSSCDDIGDPDMNDGQGNCNRTRSQAAAAIVDWLATDPTGSGSPNFLLIGDMNSYTFEDPITTFTNGGLLNLVREFDGLTAYSYVFGGESGYLDHALASPRLAANVGGVTHWHINADEPVALDYNTEFKTTNQITTFYAPTAYRSSDHDPVVIGLDLRTAPPTFTSTPSDVTVFTGAGATACGVFVSDAALGTAVATSGAPGAVTITRAGVPSGNLFPVGRTTITYTATDTVGAAATATETVTVVDNTPPEITAPPSITRGTGPGSTLPGLVISDLGFATASDNCSGVIVSLISGLPVGSLIPIGTTTNTFRAIDASGNTATAAQTVTVIDDTAPVLTVPANVTVYTGAGAAVCGAFIDTATLGEATAVDNSGIVSVTRVGGAPPGIFPVGTTTLTFKATDGAGNHATGTQLVTVVDNTRPTLTAPANVIRAATGITTLVTDSELGTATAADNCPGVTIARSGVPAGNLFPHGTTTITYTATDASGNTASATQTVTVNATATSVCVFVRSYIANAGIANSLCVKLDAAAAARARGSVNAHDNVIDAFANEVDAQRRNGTLTGAQADALIALARTL